ncbi:hypothetical protein NDA13_005922 [Ustilago tritici]|nr:hypothetical protein NDA13_005922 [Ustilago tritici]
MRQRRTDALKIALKGGKVHSLSKATVVFESRTTVWKKIACLAKRSADAIPLPLFPELPNPWDIEITHEGLDISTIKSKSKTRKKFELPRTRTSGACRRCSGSGNENRSPVSSPLLRPSSARPMSPMRRPLAAFNSDELRIKMLRHSSSLSRANFSRPLTAPGIPIKKMCFSSTLYIV